MNIDDAKIWVFCHDCSNTYEGEIYKLKEKIRATVWKIEEAKKYGNKNVKTRLSYIQAFLREK